ncbi:MAG: hypothetical protein M3329_09910, partial [Pseudomonadota bacterium]|nr:hypothetical protein [Pseudomonadota bacterium]
QRRHAHVLTRARVGVATQRMLKLSAKALFQPRPKMCHLMSLAFISLFNAVEVEKNVEPSLCQAYTALNNECSALGKSFRDVGFTRSCLIILSSACMGLA